MKEDVFVDVKIWEQDVIIPTYEVGESDIHPMFLEKRVYQGSSGKVYPLAVTETLSDEKYPKTYHAIFIENEYIKIMVLPELGGRIHRALDKTNNYDAVYYNQVIKPALVGLTGPWISGGIEFNWPQHHRPTTFSQVEYSITHQEDGSKTVWVGETDAMYGTKGMAGITLYPKSSYIEVKGQLYNSTLVPQTFLWWANPAVPVNEHTFSVFPSDVNAVMDHGKRAVSTFPIATGEYYKADYSAGVDISRYKNIEVPTSYMAYKSEYDFIGNYDESKKAGLLHVANHHISPGKKQWTWGCGDFGKCWDDNLTDSDGPYIELMTGVFTDNQPDFTWLEPHEEKTFTQYFLPYKEVGRVSNATKDIVLRYEKVDDNIEIVIYATSMYNQGYIILKENETTIYSEKVDMSPLKIFSTSISAENVDFYSTHLVVQDRDGNNLITYTPIKQELKPIPLPAKPLLEPEAIKSTEQLYLAAIHLIQYRHASYNPVDYFLEGLRRDPTDIRLNDAYGLYLYNQGKRRESESYFQRAIDTLQSNNSNPYNSDPLYHMGLCLYSRGEYKKAYELFYKATWSRASQNISYYMLACIDSHNRQYQQALEHINKALITNYHDMNSRLLKSVLLDTLKKDPILFIKESLTIDALSLPLSFELAIHEKSFSSWKALMRDEIRNYLSLASLYEHIGFYERALDVLSHYKGEHSFISFARGYIVTLTNGNQEDVIAYFMEGEKVATKGYFPHTYFEERVLTAVTNLLSNASYAHYSLGNLLYNAKRYDEAIAQWEVSYTIDNTFPTVPRNLSIAYYNYQKNPEKAYEYISRAQLLDRGDARLLLERDYIAFALGEENSARLKHLNENLETVIKRDDLYLERITLLNCLREYEKAYELIMARKFHPWEGGEGKVSTQYVYSLIGMAKRAIYNNNPSKAIQILEETYSWPRSLGEGRLPLSSDIIANYYMGLSYEVLGDREKAHIWWTRATEGTHTPIFNQYYNDQPSDTIFYSALAYKKLCKEKEARKLFHILTSYGEIHIFKKAEIDYFAVSLPETTVYHADTQTQFTLHCRYHRALGLLGLELIEEATKELHTILQINPSHQGALDALELSKISIHEW